MLIKNVKDRWLLSVCEDMFKLNVLNRIVANPQGRCVTYQLKNALVKYLYQSGYCTEALLHCQKFPCWSCEGTGEHWNGETCFKCGGTGVFREVWHYAFRFDVAGRRFYWHQPKTMVDFPVTLTPGLPEIYKDPALPAKDNIALFRRRSGLALWNIAIYLRVHGALPNCVHISQLPWIFDLLWQVRNLLWQVRKLYYRLIYYPVDAARQHLKAWILGEQLDEPPF